MIRHTDDRTIADFQVLRRNINGFFSQRIQLAAQMMQIHNHSCAHDIGRCVTQNTARQKIQDKLAAFIDNGMTGIVAALITADNFIIL